MSYLLVLRTFQFKIRLHARKVICLWFTPKIISLHKMQSRYPNLNLKTIIFYNLKSIINKLDLTLQVDPANL
jgi:hypothetical protein